MKTKILFLDFDGVLNCRDDFSMMNKKLNNTRLRRPTKKTNSIINPLMRWRVNNICHETGCKIVVSSTWRIIHTHTELEDFLKHEILGRTEKFGQRGSEIKKWIELNKEWIENFIIIDDDCFDINPHFDPINIVQTSFQEGLTHEKMEEAIRKLRVNS